MAYVDESLLTNTAKRMPVIVCYDASGSMGKSDYDPRSGQSLGRRIDRLKEGIKALYNEIVDNDDALDSVELGIVAFGTEAWEVKKLTAIDEERVNELLNDIKLAPQGKAKGDIGKGVLYSLDILADRKKKYNQRKIDYYQPILIIMSDGHATGVGDYKGKLADATKKCQTLMSETDPKGKRLTVIPVYIAENLKADVIAQNALIPLAKDKELKNVIDLGEGGTTFLSFFRWLGKSASMTASGETGEDELFSTLIGGLKEE